MGHNYPLRRDLRKWKNDIITSNAKSFAGAHQYFFDQIKNVPALLHLFLNSEYIPGPDIYTQIDQNLPIPFGQYNEKHDMEFALYEPDQEAVMKYYIITYCISKPGFKPEILLQNFATGATTSDRIKDYTKEYIDPIFQFIDGYLTDTTVPTISHPFWGKITNSRGGGYVSEVTFRHPFFGEKKWEIHLGDTDIYVTPAEFELYQGAYYKPVELILSPDTLTRFADMYAAFINNMETHLKDLQLSTFRFYQEYRSEHYDEQDIINTLEEHNEYIKNLASIHLRDNHITLNFYYQLFWAPVHYVQFANGKLDNIHGEKIKDNWLQ